MWWLWALGAGGAAYLLTKKNDTVLSVPGASPSTSNAPAAPAANDPAVAAAIAAVAAAGADVRDTRTTSEAEAIRQLYEKFYLSLGTRGSTITVKIANRGYNVFDNDLLVSNVSGFPAAQSLVGQQMKAAAELMAAGRMCIPGSVSLPCAPPSPVAAPPTSTLTEPKYQTETQREAVVRSVMENTRTPTVTR